MFKFLKSFSLICLLPLLICICSCSTLSQMVESSWTGKTIGDLQYEQEQRKIQEQYEQEQRKIQEQYEQEQKAKEDEERKKQELIKKYIESGELDKAIEAEETNDPALARILSEMYGSGNSEFNIKKSLRKTYKWLKMACDLKDPIAMNFMIEYILFKGGADFRKVNNLEFNKDYILQLCEYMAENHINDKRKKIFCNMLGLYYAECPKSNFELSKQYFQKADNQQMIEFIDEMNENWNNYLDENTSENIGLLLDSLFTFAGFDSLHKEWFVFKIIKDNRRVSAFDSIYMSIFGLDKLQTLLDKEPEECKKWFDKFSVELSLRRLDNIGSYHDLNRSISAYLTAMDDAFAFKNSLYSAYGLAGAGTDAEKKVFIIASFNIFKGSFSRSNR